MEHEVEAAWRDLVERLERTPPAAEHNPCATIGVLFGVAGLAPLVAPHALPFAAVLGAVALVLGLLGRREARLRAAPGLRAADAAMVLAAVPLVTAAVVGVVATLLLG